MGSYRWMIQNLLSAASGRWMSSLNAFEAFLKECFDTWPVAQPPYVLILVIRQVFRNPLLRMVRNKAG